MKNNLYYVNTIIKLSILGLLVYLAIGINDIRLSIGKNLVKEARAHKFLEENNKELVDAIIDNAIIDKSTATHYIIEEKNNELLIAILDLLSENNKDYKSNLEDAFMKTE